MIKNFKQKSNKKSSLTPNPLEALKDIGASTADQMKREVGQISSDVIEQLIGINTKGGNFSGELVVGESIEINEVISKSKKLEGENNRLFLQRNLIEEERRISDEKTNELKMRLKVIQEEMILIAQKTQDMAQETQIAAMQITVDPGLYHIIFFEKLLEFVQSFRKKISEAQTWLHQINKRTSKKNAWGANYKKHGAKYLLSGEHYIARSAG